MRNVSVSVSIEKTIRVEEGERYLEMAFDPEWCTVSVKENMPFHKDIDDWKFYIKALKIMVKELESNKVI